MTIALPGAPFPVTYRELWLPPGINNHATLPTSVEGGHGLTLTGARKGTTADGVHFTGAATSNINCGAIHNAAAKLYISFRFKLDQDYALGDGQQWVWGKRLDGLNYLQIRLDNATGSLLFLKATGGGADFNIYSAETSWNAGQWYHILASISSVNGARLIVDNGTPETDADVSAVPNGGDFVIGDYDDPGAGTGFQGVIADFFCEEGTDLSVAEEADLYNGFPPATVDNAYPLDEGRGVTAYDRGADSNNGTLDTSCTWAFGQVQQPLLSLDGINDHGQSAAGVDISGDITIVWAGKMKSTYEGLAVNHRIYYVLVDADNYLYFIYNQATDTFYFRMRGSGLGSIISYATKPSIDDYLIIIGTNSLAGIANLYANGIFIDGVSDVGAVSGFAATAYIGSFSIPNQWDISKPLFIALIDGASTQQQALAYSRYLKNVFNLPLTI